MVDFKKALDKKIASYIDVKIIKTGISERYCKEGDICQLDEQKNLVRCSGTWFNVTNELVFKKVTEKAQETELQKVLTREEEVLIEIEEAKINYSAIWSISNLVFTEKASEVLEIPIDRVEVRRCIMQGYEFGKLSVTIYKEDDNEKAYYRLDNGSTTHRNLSPNIFEFTKQLEDIKNNKI